MLNTKSAEQKIVSIFQRNGYFRIKDEKRYKKEGHSKYKKGYEVRLVAKNRKELILIQSLLNTLEFKYGKTYRNGNQNVIPLYGKATLMRFQQMIEE